MQEQVNRARLDFPTNGARANGGGERKRSLCPNLTQCTKLTQNETKDLSVTDKNCITFRKKTEKVFET